MSAATELIWCFGISGALAGLAYLWERWAKGGRP